MADAKVPQIDVSNYVAQKDAGNASVVKIDGVAHLRMVPEKPAPLLVPISADGVQAGIDQKNAQIAAIQVEIATLKTMLTDIGSATELGA